MSNVIFEAGDVVKCAFFGDEEFVLKEIDNSDYPILIDCASESGNRRDELFTRDGFFHVNHTSPALKLVRKKIKKRNIKDIFRVKSDNGTFLLDQDFDSYEDALDWIKGNGLNGWAYSIDKFYKVDDL